MDIWLEHVISEFENGHSEPGEVLTHDWLKWAMQVPEPKDISEFNRIQFMFLSRFEEFKTYLLVEKKVALQSVRGVGYMVVHPKDQARLAADEWSRLVTKAHKKADMLLSHVRTEELTSDERKRHLDTQVRINGVSAMVSKSKADIFQRFSLEKH